MLEDIKQEVLEANLALVKSGLVILSWGNASSYIQELGFVVIKPSGLSYDVMQAKDMVVVDMDGKVIEGDLNPSSDTQTHLEIYKAYPQIKGIVHTHSKWACTFAQMEKPILAQGTTHADHFYGTIPCTRKLSLAEVENDYEKNTGLVIIETYQDKNPLEIPAIIVGQHGPFTFGKNVKQAVDNAITLEACAQMAYYAQLAITNTLEIDDYLKDKHYFRKHGANAYYGQKK